MVMDEEHSQPFEPGQQSFDNKPEESEKPSPDIEREISLEEFQPKGTMAVTLLYFIIIVLLWIFMYFVEFAGNDPSIIG